MTDQNQKFDRESFLAAHRRLAEERRLVREQLDGLRARLREVSAEDKALSEHYRNKRGRRTSASAAGKLH
ncbi:MAG TPA: hypothetical protein VGN97_06255 [Mesorhizobium sp.]|jgi:uncharacterized membrane protein|nr:hypothetical protein [Mesorhizobium sp.]